jgi:hypothetical protein
MVAKRFSLGRLYVALRVSPFLFVQMWPPPQRAAALWRGRWAFLFLGFWDVGFLLFSTIL